MEIHVPTHNNTNIAPTSHPLIIFPFHELFIPSSSFFCLISHILYLKGLFRIYVLVYLLRDRDGDGVIMCMLWCCCYVIPPGGSTFTVSSSCCSSCCVPAGGGEFRWSFTVPRKNQMRTEDRLRNDDTYCLYVSINKRSSSTHHTHTRLDLPRPNLTN